MKKSVEEAKAQAQKLSAEHPHNTVRVLDRLAELAALAAQPAMLGQKQHPPPG